MAILAELSARCEAQIELEPPSPPLRANSIVPLWLALQTLAVDIVIMSSNNDNIMARFLFAILQQKNLKDVRLLRGIGIYLEGPGR